MLAHFKSLEPMARGNRHITLDVVIDPAPVTVPGEGGKGRDAPSGGKHPLHTHIRTHSIGIRTHTPPTPTSAPPPPPPAGAQAAAHAHGYRLLHKAAAPPLLMATGLIEDYLVKTADGQWLFAERKWVLGAGHL